jgi:group I intron endonuclease
MASAIYAIVNKTTRDMYVGSAVAVNRRWAAHRRDLRNKCHHSQRLQRAFDKYGPDAFDWEIIQFIDNRANLIDREQFWINFFSPAYNGRPIANSPLGTKHSAETRAKMSAAHKGKVFSETHRFNLYKAKKGVSTVTDAQRELLRAMGKAHVFSAEQRAKISASLIGNKRAAGKSNKNAAGSVRSAEERARISARMKEIWAQRKQSKGVSQ